MIQSIFVNNASALRAALANAKGGEIIELAPGEYGNVSLDSYNPAASVLIRGSSIGITNFATLKVDDTSNLKILNVDIGRALRAGESDTLTYALITDSAHITLAGVNIHGSLDGDNSNDGRGLRVSDSNNVAVIGSNFQQLRVSSAFFNTDNVTFAYNRVREAREGLDMAAANNVWIVDNLFEKLAPLGGEHTDAIQFWTTNTNRGVSNAFIADNAFVVGDDPQKGIQGIFISSQVPTLRHSDITIMNNVYFGGSVHGISVNSADGVFIRGNLVMTSPNLANKGTSSLTAAVRTGDSTDVVLTRNMSTDLVTTGGSEPIADGNTFIRSAKRATGALLEDVFGLSAENMMLLSAADLVPVLNASAADPLVGSGYSGGAALGQWSNSLEALVELFDGVGSPVSGALATSLASAMNGSIVGASAKGTALAPNRANALYAQEQLASSPISIAKEGGWPSSEATALADSPDSSFSGQFSAVERLPHLYQVELFGSTSWTALP